jgi:hypothetical protein
VGFSTRSNALIPGHTLKWAASATDSTNEVNQGEAGLETIRRTGRRIGNSAVYYALHLDGFRRFPVPFAENLPLLKLVTWATLVVEFATGFLVWFRSLRYAVLLFATLLHMSIEYAMNLPLFELMMVSTYATFIYPEDLSRAWAWICDRLGLRPGALTIALYDGTSSCSLRAVNTLRALDVFHRVRFIDLHSDEGKAICPEPDGPAGRNRVRFVTRTGVREGISGLCAIAPLVPLLWPLAISSLFQSHVPRSAGIAKE